MRKKAGNARSKSKEKKQWTAVSSDPDRPPPRSLAWRDRAGGETEVVSSDPDRPPPRSLAWRDRAGGETEAASLRL